MAKPKYLIIAQKNVLYVQRQNHIIARQARIAQEPEVNGAKTNMKTTQESYSLITFAVKVVQNALKLRHGIVE